MNNRRKGIRMPAHRSIALAALIALPASQASAQFLDSLLGSKVAVMIDHPASLPLHVSTIALAEPEGRCGDSILGRIEADFVQSGVNVVDRGQLNQVLREQRLQVSGLVNQKSAANVGQLLGAQALVFLKVLHCNSDRRTEQFTDKKKQRIDKYITTATIRGSLRTVDLNTGLVLAAQSLEESGGLESWDGYPDPDQVIGMQEVAVAQAVHKMFLPWKEKRSVVFYGDKECNLKAAYKLLQARDIEGALAKAEVAVAGCKETPGAKEKTLGHAYYNLGLVQFLRRDYENAASNLSEAAKLQGGKIVLDLLGEVKVAQSREAGSAAQPEKVAARSGGANRPAAAAPNKLTSVEERLKQLESLKQKGLLTQDEYNRKRAQIIDGI